jgi:hypothetical protein
LSPFGEWEKNIPFVVSPLYISANTGAVNEITICTSMTRKNSTIEEPFLNLAMCNDMSFDKIKEFVSSFYVNKLMIYDPIKLILTTTYGGNFAPKIA